MAERKTRTGSCHSVRVHRREFIKLAAAGAAGLLAGCRAAPQPTTVPTDEPTALPASEPTIPATATVDFSRMAYCGILCREACPEGAYPTRCDGCKSEDGKLHPFCETCSIRECAREKQVMTCAHCEDYPSCDVDTWAMLPRLRRQIDQIRSSLRTQP